MAHNAEAAPTAIGAVRSAVVLVLVLALGGCASPEPTPPEPQNDGLVATATPLVPLITPVEGEGTFGDRPCLSVAPPCEPLMSKAFVLEVDEPAALFWRINLTAHWTSNDPITSGATVYIEALPDCATADPCDCPACTGERIITRASGPSPIELAREFILEPGDTGLRVRYAIHGDPIDSRSPAVGPLVMDYRISGLVTAFVAAGEPIRL